MLTNEVQIAYSQTEGYAPVTSKAQKSAAYTDYLSRAGEDNQLYYDIKLRATQLLLDNTENTFVTAVFNGSASLRNAAGQMIENVTKSVRRGEKVNAFYVKALYDDVTSLYRLDQIVRDDARQEFGPLPAGAAALLAALGVCWVGMGVYVAAGYFRKKKLIKTRGND